MRGDDTLEHNDEGVRGEVQGCRGCEGDGRGGVRLGWDVTGVEDPVKDV